MPRPTPKATLIAAAAVGVGVGGFALVGHTDSHQATAGTDRFGGLEASFSGRAFAKAPDGGAPVLAVSGLAPGGDTSGSVTLRNPGPDSRYFWLTPGTARERLGAVGRLTAALSLDVLDVTDMARPVSVYRGPLESIGAQALGFLAPGGHRTYTFTASLPGTGPGGANPYRGGRVEQSWQWQSIPASSGATSLAALRPTPRPRPVARPKVRFTVARVQEVLATGTLRVTVSCGTGCRIGSLTASARTGSRTWPLAVDTAGQQATARFAPPALAALRSALEAGTTTPVTLRATARGRSGASTTSTHTLTVRPQD